jgi:ribosomal protein L3
MKISVYKGTQQVTVQNLQVVEIDVAKGLLMVKGAVPGHRNGIVKVVSTGTVKPLVTIIVEKDDKKKK